MAVMPRLSVFVGAAKFRLHANPPRGFEKNIRRRFLVFHHFTRDDGVEQLPDVQAFQHQGDDFFRAAGRNGHRDFAVMRLRNVHDGMNRFDLRQGGQIGFLLFVRDGDVVERTALFLRRAA